MKYKSLTIVISIDLHVHARRFMIIGNTVLSYNHMTCMVSIMILLVTLLLYKVFGFVITDSIDVTDFITKPHPVELVSTL